ncbi:MAG: zinc-finger domain-containing protein [Robiginitomaculum sp.]|nr:zinc-finger domain-containing protein [Robiginitomaculum sp.]
MTKNATTHLKPEIEMVDTHSVSCDGGGGADGHPKVFMDMGQENHVECKYCGKRFVFKS